MNPLGLAADDVAAYASIAEHVAALSRSEGEPRPRAPRFAELQPSAAVLVCSLTNSVPL